MGVAAARKLSGRDVVFQSLHMCRQQASSCRVASRRVTGGERGRRPRMDGWILRHVSLARILERECLAPRRNASCPPAFLSTATPGTLLRPLPRPRRPTLSFTFTTGEYACTASLYVDGMLTRAVDDTRHDTRPTHSFSTVYRLNVRRCSLGPRIRATILTRRVPLV